MSDRAPQDGEQAAVAVDDPGRCPVTFRGRRCFKSVGHEHNHLAHMGEWQVHGWYCDEHDYRESLSDGDFWSLVLLGSVDRPEVEPEYDPEDFEVHGIIPTPCPECGQTGACGYDADGRAYVHVTEEADDA